MIYFVLYVYDIREFMDYAPVLFASFYVTYISRILLEFIKEKFQSGVAILSAIFKGKIIHTLPDDISLWALDSGGEKIHSEIRFKARMVTIFVICNTLLIIGGIILNLIPLSDDLHVYFALRFIHEYFPNHKTCLIILLKASIFPVIPHMLVVHAYQILYYTQHSNFQIQLFNKVIAEVDFWETPLRETELFYSKPYQKGIEKKLKFCIQRLQVLINAYIVKTKEIGTLIALFAICGVLMGIGFSLYLFSGKFTPEYYLRLTFMTLVAVTTFSSIIWGGQSTETIITEMITALCQVRWYNFSQTNKKLYLILLTNMMKDRKIKFTENYSINYQLGLAVRNLFFILLEYLWWFSDRQRNLLDHVCCCKNALINTY
nr:PREDICTED: uncharacterized protein LOC103312914 isoform X1 [Tribolium castaneum]|eukprot:XP_015835421.1 PREDICTED: uncharacterized protein LOC103312914 isoform X1 [Tribolium castaneum]